MAQDEVLFSPGELHATFYNDLFVLKTTATIDGQPAEIDFSKNDELSLRFRSSKFRICFREVSAQLGALLRKYGVCQVNSVWCGAKPFIHVAFPSAHGLKTFLDAKHKVEVDVASLFSQHLSQSTAEPHPLGCEVETELFLISPDAEHECAYYYSVTKGNCNECLSQLKNSKVFQFDTLFQSKPQENLAKDDQPSLLDLISQLEEVVEWFHLGLYLGVPEYELLSIDKSKRGDVKECRTGMLSWWLQCGTTRRWTSVVRAVEGIKMEPLARKIATKYGVPVRQPSEQPTLPAITKVSPELRQDLDSLEKRTPELNKTKEAINKERKKKATIEKRRFDTKQQLVVSSEKLKKLTRERDETKKELEEMEEELEFLQPIDDEGTISDKKQEIQRLEQDVARVERELTEAKDAQVTTMTKRIEELSEERDQIKTEIEKREKELEIFRRKAHNQENNAKLRAIIERKEAEVGRLRSHMAEVAEDLSRTKEQHDKFREQLKETTAELSKNCEVVRELEKYEAELERERSRVDAKLKMEFAKSEGVELPEADEASTAQKLDSLKQDVHNRDEEIRRLTSLLKTKEEVAEGRGGEGEREVELSDVKAKLEEEKDGRMRSEEELKSLQRIPDPHEDVSKGEEPRFLIPPPPLATKPKPSLPSPSSVSASEREDKTGHDTDPRQLSASAETVPLPPGTPTVVALRKLEAPITSINCNGPLGVAVGKRGQIIIAEGGLDRISIYSNGKKITSFGRNGSTQGQFKSPRGIAVDGVGKILVVDENNHRIQKFRDSGKFIASVGTLGEGARQFKFPIGIGINSSEKVYICDRSNHRVQILNPDLTFSTSFGRWGSGDGHLKFPWDVAFNSRGNIYIAEKENHCIHIFTEDGRFLRKFGTHGDQDGELKLPVGVAIDSDDVVHVVEEGNHRISLFNNADHFMRSFGTQGKGPGQFNRPNAITIDKDGLVYVCDWGNDRLQIW